MRKRMLWAVGLLLLTIATGEPFAAREVVTLEGSYVWSREDSNRTGDLRAVFTRTGKTKWKVAFHFDWEDEAHIFSGTARGSLSSGELKGKVDSDEEDHKLAFEFQGSFENGTFQGTHGYFQNDGTLKNGGTLTLRPRS